MDPKQAKGALIDIVKHAYKGSPKLKEYCSFGYEIVPKELKTKHGDYNCGTRNIRIFNEKSRTLTHLITTSIHELAHHIDNCNRGTSDHSGLFYEEYRKLLFAALDMRMFSIKEALEIKRDAADGTKEKLMIIEYMEEHREKKEFIERASSISVYNAFPIKEDLKAIGFRWNSVTKAWTKELTDDAQEIIRKVEALTAGSEGCITYELIEPPRFDAPAELPASFCFHEFTDEEKEKLKEGEEIYIAKCWSRKRALFFSCHLRWDGEQLVPRFGD